MSTAPAWHVPHVGAEPRNAAADFTRTAMEVMNDRDVMTSIDATGCSLRASCASIIDA